MARGGSDDIRNRQAKHLLICGDGELGELIAWTQVSVDRSDEQTTTRDVFNACERPKLRGVNATIPAITRRVACGTGLVVRRGGSQRVLQICVADVATRREDTRSIGRIERNRKRRRPAIRISSRRTATCDLQRWAPHSPSA